jgi:hypothetical protein
MWGILSLPHDVRNRVRPSTKPGCYLARSRTVQQRMAQAVQLHMLGMSWAQQLAARHCHSSCSSLAAFHDVLREQL